MRVTEKQEREFYDARKRFLDAISMFEYGVNYAEERLNDETEVKNWINKLRDAVLNLNTEELRQMSGKDYGYAISNYQRNLEEIFLRMFKMVLPAFSVTLEWYTAEILRIFM